MGSSYNSFYSLYTWMWTIAGGIVEWSARCCLQHISYFSILTFQFSIFQYNLEFSSKAFSFSSPFLCLSWNTLQQGPAKKSNIFDNMWWLRNRWGAGVSHGIKMGMGDVAQNMLFPNRDFHIQPTKFHFNYNCVWLFRSFYNNQPTLILPASPHIISSTWTSFPASIQMSFS